MESCWGQYCGNALEGRIRSEAGAAAQGGAALIQKYKPNALIHETFQKSAWFNMIFREFQILEYLNFGLGLLSWLSLDHIPKSRNSKKKFWFQMLQIRKTEFIVQCRMECPLLVMWIGALYLTVLFYVVIMLHLIHLKRINET